MKASTFALAAAAALIPAIAAQDSVEDIDENTRVYWCEQQVAACPLLCLDQGHQSTRTNRCYPDNLYYSCICSDGLEPSYDEYSMTIPYFRCNINLQGCISGCGGNNGCIDQCKKTYHCGAIDPTKSNATTTPTTSTASSTSSPTQGASDEDEDEDSGDAGSGFAHVGDKPKENDDEDNAAGRFGAFAGVYGLGLFGAAVAGAAALL